MDFRPSTYSLRLDWTLPLLAKPKNAESVHVQDFDVALEISYWDNGSSFGWEVSSVCFDGPRPVYVTPDNDPAFWAIVKRALDAEDKNLDARIQDMAALDYEPVHEWEDE